MAEHVQVVIVGGGPVGVGLAVELGQRGVSCAVVERHLEVGKIPKGQNLTQRTLEHFYFWHCVDELRGRRLLPPGYPIGGLTAYRNFLTDYWYATEGLDAVRDYYFQKNERLPQYLTEEVLRERMVKLPSVQSFFGWTAKEITQDGSGVRVKMTGEEWPYEDDEITGDYLVGCDGARSLVRESVGITREGPNFDQKMLLAVFRSTELHEALERFPERTTYRIMKPEHSGVWQFFGRVDVGSTWFYHGPVPRETTTEDRENLKRVIHEAAGFEFPIEFQHVGFWELRVEVATTYQVGRVFIAGDSAHSHPPYGGFGLNTGLEDVVNLGWKLGATFEGWGSEKLLESYSMERQPVFQETGEKVIAGWIESDREFLERFSPDRDLAEFEAEWGKRTQGDTATPGYEPNYEGSPVVFGSAGAKVGVEGGHSFEARPGHHLAPVACSSGRNVFEELGTGFTLLDLGAGAGEVFSAAAKSLGVPLTVVADTFDGPRTELESRLVLVRPDQYVAWCANEAPADPEAVLRRVTGRD